MRWRLDLTVKLAAVLALAACDEPRDRDLQLNPPPVAPDPLTRPPAERDLVIERERPSSIAWDEASQSFEVDGAPLEAARLWTFDRSSDGFTMVGGELAPAEEEGLLVATRVFDAVLRSPSALSLPGDRYPLVLVRLSRLRAGEAWDGALYYVTAAHGESAQFMAKPLSGDEPEVGETVTLVYDMRQLRRGGEDWVTSSVDQLRLDLDDGVGGEFVIHQMAITKPPADPAPAPEPGAALRPKN